MVEVNFTVKLTKDEKISESGILETKNADSEFPIRWFDYGLRWFFPNNPFDRNFEIGEYNRHEELRNYVLNDKELIQFLCDFAEEPATILREGYCLIINGGAVND